MHTPNPLPCGCRDHAKGIEVECGCRVVGTAEWDHNDHFNAFRIKWVNVHIHYCPLHAAAADLLAALKDCLPHIEALEGESMKSAIGDAARAAIAKAEPPTARIRGGTP